MMSNNGITMNRFSPLSMPPTRRSTTPRNSNLVAPVPHLRHSASTDGLHQFLESEWKDVRYTLEGREKNKKDIQLLNERLADHIEKTRFLGAENKKLQEEMRFLKTNWFDENAKTHKIYEDELLQLRRNIEESERRTGEKEARLLTLEAALQDAHVQLQDEISKNGKVLTRMDSQAKELAQREAELSMMKRRLESFDEVNSREKVGYARAKSEINQLQSELEHTRSSFQSMENKQQSLLQELDLLRRTHEQELKELRVILNHNSNYSSEDNRQFWHNELSVAIREIQQVYDKRFEQEKQDMEEKLMQKLHEIGSTRIQNKAEFTRMEEDNKRLKNSVDELRRRLVETQKELSTISEEKSSWEDEIKRLEVDNATLKRNLECLESDMNKTLFDLNALTDAKLNIEAEVETYRRLLEVENESESNNLASMLLKNHNKIVEAEVTARTQFDKSFTGPLYIEECSTDGRYIEIGNNGNKSEALSKWRIVRNIDHDKHVVRFTFSEGIVESGQFIKIWARGQKPPHAKVNDIECPYTNWGNGTNVESILYDSNGSERARHTQRTSFKKL